MVRVLSQTSSKCVYLVATELYDESLGRLAPVPRYGNLPSVLSNSPGRSCYITIHNVIEKLGRAMQLGQHRRLIDSLDRSLGWDTLAAMTSISLMDREVCAAFAVYLTTLEQSYHWPRDASYSTPNMLENHKLVIQMLNQPQLRQMLQHSLRLGLHHEQHLTSSDRIARVALYLSRLMLEEARLAQENGTVLDRNTQDTINLLYRTCRSDWGDQGDYNDPHSHREFGRLHEVVRASGTQRRMQELFEESGGIVCIRIASELLNRLPAAPNVLCDILTQLQFAVAIVREELFTVSIDEIIWGRVFANFSKAVGFSDISAGGGDAPVFWMLDTLCGQADPSRQAALPEDLEFRSRYFPSNMQALVRQMRDLPAIREYCNSPSASDELKQSFKALERQRFELYEMHRKKAARIGLALRAGQRGTSGGVSGCAYATPEKQLAKTLDAAVMARFGVDKDATLLTLQHDPIL